MPMILKTKLNHPVINPAKGPKASCAYNNGPPVPLKRLPTSAKQKMIRLMAPTHTSIANKLYEPLFANTCDGNP